MKPLLFILFTPLFSKGQYIPDPTDYVQPYLLSDGRVIVGANTSLLNADSLETDIDTIFYEMAVSFPRTPGLTVGISGDTTLKYAVMLTTKAYAIWQRDPIVGNHWHIYDELRRPIEFLIRRGVVIWKIIETGQK